MKKFIFFAKSQDHSEDFNEIMRRYSDFVSSPDDNEEESERYNKDLKSL